MTLNKRSTFRMGEFERFNGLDMMPGLTGYTKTSGPKCDSCSRKGGIECCNEAKAIEISSTLESCRPRSTILSKPWISSRLVASGLSQPYSTHFPKLIFVSD